MHLTLAVLFYSLIERVDAAVIQKRLKENMDNLMDLKEGF